MPELGSYGSVRGARGNSRPYREPRPIADSDRMTKQTDHVPTRREHSDPSQGM